MFQFIPNKFYNNTCLGLCKHCSAIIAIIVVMLLSCFNYATAQTKDTTNEYIKKYSHYLNLTVGYNNRNTEYQIASSNSNLNFVIAPPPTRQIQVAVDYRYLSVSLSFTPSIINETTNDNLKGNSSRKTFSLGARYRNWYFNFVNQKITGFYVKNTIDFQSNWTDGLPFIQLPTLKNSITCFDVTYNVNKNFSYRSFNSGIEEQQKNAFTFLPRLSINRLAFESTSSGTGNQNADRNFDVNLCLPIAYNAIIKKGLYATGLVGPLVGVSYFKYESFNNGNRVAIQSTQNISLGYTARLGVGYTNSSFFTGVDLQQTYYKSDNATGSAAVRFYGIQVYVGSRIKPPKFLRRATDWVNKTSPVKLE